MSDETMTVGSHKPGIWAGKATLAVIANSGAVSTAHWAARRTREIGSMKNNSTEARKR